MSVKELGLVGIIVEFWLEPQHVVTWAVITAGTLVGLPEGNMFV